LHSHEHYMSIHYYVWLYLENEEEVEVEEAKTSQPPPEEHQSGNYFYFDICGIDPDSPVTQGKPRCICHLLVPFKIFLTYLMH
jgi:hemolysin-activating ACP:hemolysin acyltransferase